MRGRWPHLACAKHEVRSCQAEMVGYPPVKRLPDGDDFPIQNNGVTSQLTASKCETTSITAHRPPPPTGNGTSRNSKNSFGRGIQRKWTWERYGNTQLYAIRGVGYHIDPTPAHPPSTQKGGRHLARPWALAEHALGDLQDGPQPLLLQPDLELHRPLVEESHRQGCPFLLFYENEEMMASLLLSVSTSWR